MAKPAPSAPNPAGYSGTPLPKKLGIKEGSVVITFGEPKGFRETLGELPKDITYKKNTKAPFSVAIAFVKSRVELEEQVDSLKSLVTPGVGLWIAWPKKASGIVTDVTEDTIRKVVLPLGLVDVKVCAIDAIWSGLRLVSRKK